MKKSYKILVRSLGVAALAVGFLAGCNNAKDSSGTAGRVVTANAAIPTYSTGQSAVALNATVDPTQAVKNLFSGIINSSQIGTVASTGSMLMYGQFHLDSNTGSLSRAVVPSTSYLALVIKDSYAAAGQASPLQYQIGMNSLSNGTLVYNYYGGPAQVNMNFQDSYGTQITVTGQISADANSQFTGYVSVGKSGQTTQLGQFSMATCGIFICQ